MNKYLVSVREVALYEIFADNKKEAEKLVATGEGGDFVGYDDKVETVISVEEFEKRPAW